MALLSEYVDQLFGVEDTLLRQMRQEAESAGLPAIQVPPDLGRLLGILIAWHKPQLVLEIGTLFGYSTVLMARSLANGARLVTLEVETRHAEFAQRNFVRAGVSDRVELLLGPAVDSLAKLRDRTFDMVFIDADKQSYPSYLKWSLELTRSGSLIIADNVWRGGSILDPQDETQRGIANFNQAIASESRLLSTIISTRNGEDGTSISLVV